jgi:hypothetical protein
MILLDADHKPTLWKYFWITFALYWATVAFDMNCSSGCKMSRNGDSGHLWYQVCYGVFVVIAGAFLTVVQIPRLGNNQPTVETMRQGQTIDVSADSRTMRD